jgi:hypothetical protein
MEEQMQQIEPGVILASSWGYDQTNVDFYRVDKVKGDWATLQQIAANEASDGAQTMTGRVVPAEPHRPVDKPFRRKIGPPVCGEPMLRISSYEYAWPWDGKPKFVSHYA